MEIPRRCLDAASESN